MRTTATALLATILLSSLATSAHAVAIVSTDFSGRTVAGATASNILWTTNGVADPGDLTAVPVGGGTFGGLFDTGNAQGHFAPDRNTGNEGPWSTTIPLVLTTAQVQLVDLELDWQHFNNSGAFQGVSRSVDWTVTVTGSVSGVVGTETALNVTGTSGLETLTFGAPLVLNNTETFDVEILAEGSNATGNNTGLDAVTLNGEIIAVEPTGTPEPSTFVLASLGLLAFCMGGRRRKNR